MVTIVDAPVPARSLSLWRRPDYLLLWGGQAVSAIGTQVSNLALPLLMLSVTGSPAQAGLLGGLRGIAYLLFGLPAGVWVDRWDRKRVLVLCDLARALLFASIPLALLTGHLTAAQLYAVSLVEGILFILFGLAETACLSRVVPPQQLPTAVAQNQATEATSWLVGPPLGGVLYGFARAVPFLLDAITFAASAVAILFIKTPLREETATGRRAMRAEIAEGLAWIRRRRALLTLMWLNGGINLVYGGWTLVVIALAQRLGATSAQIGFIFACGGAATILGSMITPAVQRRFSVGAIVVTITWIFAATWPPYALAGNLWLLGLMNGVGFFLVPINTSTHFSYRLLLLPDALQGRVNSVFRMTGFGAQSAGFIAMGLLLEWFGPVGTIWVTTVPAFALALLPTLSGSLRRAGRLASVTAERANQAS